MKILNVLLGSALSTVVSAWNADVHNQISFMAEGFLTKDTIRVVKRILEPEYNGSIGRAAAWADGYRREPGGEYTYQWHWIDSLDTVSLEALSYAYIINRCSLQQCAIPTTIVIARKAVALFPRLPTKA